MRIEYQYCGTRVISKPKPFGKKIRRVWYIEFYSYDRQLWEKYTEIEPVPKKAIIKSIHEYGNGVYALPFQERVENKMNEIKKEYRILKMYDKFTPNHFAYKNCLGMDVFHGDQLERVLILKKR